MGAGGINAFSAAKTAGTSVSRAVAVYSGKVIVFASAGIGSGYAGTQLGHALGWSDAHSQLLGIGTGLLGGAITGWGLNKVDQAYNISGYYKPTTSNNYTVEDFQKELSELPKAKIDSHDIELVQNTPKGSKPSPSEYMSQQDIDTHLSLFDEGAVKLQSSETYIKNIEKYVTTIGDESGTFVMPDNLVDKAIAASKGDPKVLENLLSLDEGYLGNSPVVIKFNEASGIRVPTGNESGAWPEYWVPGGYTGGGVPEAVINPSPIGTYEVVSAYQSTRVFNSSNFSPSIGAFGYLKNEEHSGE